MNNRQRTQTDRLKNLDNLLAGMPISDPAEGFADRVLKRLSSEKQVPALAARRFPAEWKNGLVAAAATLAFVASGIPDRIAAADSAKVGTFIQAKVLAAVEFGIRFIDFM